MAYLETGEEVKQEEESAASGCKADAQFEDVPVEEEGPGEVAKGGRGGKGYRKGCGKKGRGRKGKKTWKGKGSQPQGHAKGSQDAKGGKAGGADGQQVKGWKKGKGKGGQKGKSKQEAATNSGHYVDGGFVTLDGVFHA